LLLRAVMAAGCDPEARNALGQRAIDLLPRAAVEARCLLGLAAAAARCPATGAAFGAEELRYLCHSSGVLFSEEASAEVTVRERVPAEERDEGGGQAEEGEGEGEGEGALPRLAMVPARMGADLVYAVADAEAALEAALNPFAAATAAAEAAAAHRGSVGEGEPASGPVSPAALAGGSARGAAWASANGFALVGVQGCVFVAGDASMVALEQWSSAARGDRSRGGEPAWRARTPPAATRRSSSSPTRCA
jgi:hypothetical protein